MPLDGLMLNALTTELRDRLIGARIDRVYQPQKQMLILNLRQKREISRLLISAEPQSPRIYLTENNYPNPQSPPMFCMLLRKHLEGGKIAAFNQNGLERILDISVAARNEIGQPVERHIIVEIMGKHSNILLLDGETNNIIDAIKRYTHAVSRHREVLPGIPYIQPPDQNKENPMLISEEKFREKLLEQPLEEKIFKVVLDSLEGFSPLMAQEAVYRTGLEQNLAIEYCGEFELHRLWSSVQDMLKEVIENNPGPSLVLNNQGEGYRDFAPLRIKLYPAEEQQQEKSPSQTLDLFYTTAEKIRKREVTRRQLNKIVSKEIKRCRKKASLQKQTVDASKDAEKYRIAGELITANIYRVKRGDRELVCENFYSETGEKVSVKLEPELSPSENAQKYFHKYNKAKNAARQAKEQLEKTRQEWDYLDSIAYSISEADDMEELKAVENELIASGYVNTGLKAGSRKDKVTQKSQPLKFQSGDGFTIMVGKNNRQNDRLTMRLAGDDDFWLHVKNIPGSHVIIFTAGKKVPDRTIEEAALLAAFYSKSRNSANVPVDYTLRRHVKKPGGAKPGMVIYENQTTAFVTPSEEAVQRLRSNRSNN